MRWKRKYEKFSIKNKDYPSVKGKFPRWKIRPERLSRCPYVRILPKDKAQIVNKMEVKQYSKTDSVLFMGLRNNWRRARIYIFREHRRWLIGVGIQYVVQLKFNVHRYTLAKFFEELYNTKEEPPDEKKGMKNINFEIKPDIYAKQITRNL